MYSYTNLNKKTKLYNAWCVYFWKNYFAWAIILYPYFSLQHWMIYASRILNVQSKYCKSVNIQRAPLRPPQPKRSQLTKVWDKMFIKSERMPKSLWFLSLAINLFFGKLNHFKNIQFNFKLFVRFPHTMVQFIAWLFYQIEI